MFIEQGTIDQAIQRLISLHGEANHQRIEQGVRQTAQFWKSRDGNAEAFIGFCEKNFIADPEMLDATLKRFDNNLESLYGNLHRIERYFMRSMHLDIGPMLPVDYLFAEYSPYAHVNEDLFKTKIAFTVLLNFPMYDLEKRLELGSKWSRKEWAKARLTEEFSVRVPADASQRLNEAYVKADDYISNYNIFMHHILDEGGNRPFRPGLKLISHWGLRDELKAQYANPDGLKKQEIIYTIMNRIIKQQIPEMVINNPAVDWNLKDNSVIPASVQDIPDVESTESVSSEREPDTRYEQLLRIFKAEKGVDSFYPTMPTKMDRRFQRDREIPESEVEALFIDILTSNEVKRTAKLIENRLGRQLKPFDIWYDGFKARGAISETKLDKIVGQKYPNIETFEAGIPDILLRLGFDRSMATYLGRKITVDPARGSGHAWGARMREDNAHLRTRFAPGKPMTYKGYNIALHEMGHNVEQVFSISKIDWIILEGVPNTAFTEAFAFVFQGRDLDVLGVTKKNPVNEHLRVLDMLWSAFEIGSVSLVDMRVWHWMYEHPKAKPAELREAVIQISREVWNEYMAPVMGQEDEIILGVYSHMIDAGLYLPDYPLGFIIAYQIEDYLKGKNLGKEMGRMCTLGSITPDAWMQAAVGGPVSTKPLLKAAGEALEVVE
ncbi:hypothetical protein JW835_02130 [bacterium]|nr:hypothetical protein [bacterium]